MKNYDYISWKNWTGKFSSLSKYKKKYYSKELFLAGIDIKKEYNVLEIGFGNGEFLKYCQLNKWNYVGVELNECLISQATELNYGKILKNNSDNFYGKGYDLIVAFDVIEHFSDQELINLLFKVKEMLSIGGIFLATFPNGDSPIGLRNQNGDITHLTAIGSKKILYFVNVLEVSLLRLSGQAEVLIGNSLLGSIRRLFCYPIKKFLDLFINFIFYPYKNFSSSNLVFVFKK